MTTLDDYRDVARQIEGWFTWRDLFEATKYLGVDPQRTSNALSTLRGRGELEIFEKSSQRFSHGQKYRMRKTQNEEASRGEGEE